MKKLLSLLCTMAIILATVIVPGMFSASAANFTVTKVSSNVTDNGDGSYTNTNPANSNYYDGYVYTDFAMQLGKYYNVSFRFDGSNGEAGRGIHIFATDTAYYDNGILKQVIYQKTAVGSPRDMGVTFLADDIATAAKNRIAFKIAGLGANATLSNIKITEVPADDYIHAVAGTNKWQQTVTDDGSTVVATDLFVSNYGDDVMIFDYVLDPTASYKIEYEWKGLNKGPAGIKTSWSAVASTASTAIPGGNRIASPATDNDSSFTAYTVTGTGVEFGASATNKYLAFIAKNFNGDNGIEAYGYLRKVKVTVTQEGTGGNDDENNGGEGSFAEGGFGAGDGTTMVPVAGSANITSATVAEKLGYGLKTSSAQLGTMVFDYEISADKWYVFEFDFYAAQTGVLPDLISLTTASAKTGNPTLSTTSRKITGMRNIDDDIGKWQSMSYLFKGSWLGASASSKYFAFTTSCVGDLLFNAMNIHEVDMTTGTAYYPTAFSGEDNVSNKAIINEDGSISFGNDKNGSWQVTRWAFDRALELDKYYLVTMDLMGHNYYEGEKPLRFGSVADPTSTSGFAKKIKVDIDGRKSNYKYTRHSYVFKGSDLVTADKPYFAIELCHFSYTCVFKNLQITEISDYATGGMNFGDEGVYATEKILTSIPKAIEATVYFPNTIDSYVHGGTILGNFGGESEATKFSLEVAQNGAPQLKFQASGKTAQTYKFNNIDLYNGKLTKILVTLENNQAKCYIDGELKQTIDIAGLNTILASQLNDPVAFGSDLDATTYHFFDGQIKSLSAYSDVNKSNLIFTYETQYNNYSVLEIADKSGNGYDLEFIAEMFSTKPPVDDYAYSFAVVGDTQTVNRYYSEHYDKIHSWILDNVDSKNIEMVIGLGDITDGNLDDEWNRAKDSIGKMNGVVPYILARGNHDGTDKFNNTFNKPVYTDQLEGMYNNKIDNSWTTLKVGEIDYLFLNLDFGPSDDVLAWASDVVEAHPKHNVIVVTHSYLDTDGEPTDKTDEHAPSNYNGMSHANNGDDMWKEFVKKHSNIVMVLSGHVTGDDIILTQRPGDNGNVISEFLIDPQYVDFRYNDSCGIVAMFYFSEDGRNVEVEYYSTILDKYYKPSNQFKFELNVITEPADYSGVDAAIGAANALIKENYKDFSGVDSAIAAVIRNMAVTEQAAVDAMAKAINDAISALEYKDADYSAIDKLLEEFDALDASIYTDESIIAVDEIVYDIEEGLDITQQSKVDAWAEALEAAIAALEKKPADYSAVDAAINAAKALDAEDYTNFADVENAIAAVERGLDITKQDEVDAMAKAIEDAIDALKESADYSAVKNAIKAAEAIEANSYTNFDVVEAAINAVEYGLDASKQAEVDAMAKAIEDAIDALIERADYSAFLEIIEKYEDEIGEEEEYTEESVAALKAVMDKIAANSNLPADKQADVDALAEEFEAAIKALVKKPVADNNDSKVEDKEDEKVEDNKTDKTPDKTGDTSNVAVTVIALITSVLGLAVLVIAKKRKA